MSSTDGSSSERLSDALNRIFSRFDDPDDGVETERGAAGEPGLEPHLRGVEPIEDDRTAPFEFPEIVPATTDGSGTPGNGPAAAAGPSARAAPVLPGTAPTVTAPGATPAPPAQAAAPVRPATGWADHMTAVPTNRGSTLRTAGRRPRVRRVTRVVRHVDPWSVFKVGLLFSLVGYVVALTSGVLLWRVADRTGTIDNVERWFTQFGWETFELQGGEIFDNAWVIGLFGVVGVTGGLVLAATLFNLVSDIVGGVRVSVLEEEVVERTVTSTRRYVVRQGPSATPVATAPQWDLDDEPVPPAPSAPPAPPAPTGRATAEASSPAASGASDWSVDD